MAGEPENLRDPGLADTRPSLAVIADSRETVAASIVDPYTRETSNVSAVDADELSSFGVASARATGERSGARMLTELSGSTSTNEALRLSPEVTSLLEFISGNQSLVDDLKKISEGNEGKQREILDFFVKAEAMMKNVADK